MEGWEEVQLKDVAKFRGGGTPSKSREDFWNGNIPWVSPKDMKRRFISTSIDSITEQAISESSASLLPVGSVLVVVRSGILKRTIPTAIAERDLTVNQDIKAICPSAKVDSQFLEYLLQSRERDLLNLVTRGATVHRLSVDVLKSLPIPLPPLPEQERIVAILDEAFAAIATATANAEKNLANARELFESQLDQAFSGVDSGDVAMEGWELSKLEAISESVDYGHTASAEIDGSGPKFLRITDIQDGSVDWHTVPTCTCDLNDQAKYRLESGDIVFARTGATTGKSFLIDECPEAAIFASYLIRVRPSKEVLPDYLAHYFYSPMYWEQITKSATGSAQPGVNASKLKQLQVPTPSLPAQERIVAILDEASAKSKQLEQISTDKLDHLTNLKQSLLHKAFTGELTADKKAADRTLSEAAV